MAITAIQARQELARRELERRGASLEASPPQAPAQPAPSVAPMPQPRSGFGLESAQTIGAQPQITPEEILRGTSTWPGDPFPNPIIAAMRYLGAGMEQMRHGGSYGENLTREIRSGGQTTQLQNGQPDRMDQLIKDVGSQELTGRGITAGAAGILGVLGLRAAGRGIAHATQPIRDALGPATRLEMPPHVTPLPPEEVSRLARLSPASKTAYYALEQSKAVQQQQAARAALTSETRQIGQEIVAKKRALAQAMPAAAAKDLSTLPNAFISLLKQHSDLYDQKLQWIIAEAERVSGQQISFTREELNQLIADKYLPERVEVPVTSGRLPETQALAQEASQMPSRQAMPRPPTPPGLMTPEQVPAMTPGGSPLRPELQPPEGVHPMIGAPPGDSGPSLGQPQMPSHPDPLSILMQESDPTQYRAMMNLLDQSGIVNRDHISAQQLHTIAKEVSPNVYGKPFTPEQLVRQHLRDLLLQGLMRRGVDVQPVNDLWSKWVPVRTLGYKLQTEVGPSKVMQIVTGKNPVAQKNFEKLQALAGESFDKETRALYAQLNATKQDQVLQDAKQAARAELLRQSAGIARDSRIWQKMQIKSASQMRDTVRYLILVAAGGAAAKLGWGWLGHLGHAAHAPTQ